MFQHSTTRLIGSGFLLDAGWPEPTITFGAATATITLFVAYSVLALGRRCQIARAQIGPGLSVSSRACRAERESSDVTVVGSPRASADITTSSADDAEIERSLARLSHELRSPLSGVMGFAELLATTELTPEQREFVTAIVIASEQLREQVERFTAEECRPSTRQPEREAPSLANSHPATAATAGQHLVPPPQAGDDATAPLVMVIDDDATVRHLITRLLGRYGYRFEVFSRADGALARLQGERFDIVLTDVTMSPMTGVAFAHQARAALGTATPPIIAITGVADDARASGLFDQVIAKPLRSHDLEVALAAWCPPGRV